MNNSTKDYQLKTVQYPPDVADAMAWRAVYEEKEDGQGEFVKQMLTGTQAKTAYAIRFNAERMIKEGSLESAVFLTLTVGDMGPDPELPGEEKFFGIKDSDEANRRLNNLNRRVLPDLFERAIIVTERHKSGCVHYHILGTLKGRPDVRTGFDFGRVKKKDYRSVSRRMLNIWEFLRKILPEYGFGRAETHPVRKTGQAVAAYVSKYIEKNVCNRMASDKHKKLVRYLGWDGSQLKPNGFAWAGQRSTAWRLKTKQSFALVDIQEPEQAAFALGPRWAFHVTNLWRLVSNEPSPGLIATYKEKDFLKREFWRLNDKWFRSREIAAENAARELSLIDQYLDDDADFRRWHEGNTIQTGEFNQLEVNILQNN